MSGKRIVVIGDALLDVDLAGAATRLAPDAAAPVISQVSRRERPGGAALAASLLAADGHDVVLVSAFGEDPNSRRIRELLPERVEVVALPLEGAAPRKTRVRGNGQLVARLDDGGGMVASDRPRERRAAAVIGHADGVLVSDYGGGMTSLLRPHIATAVSRVPTVWDPHPRGVDPVPGVAAVTPNAVEAALFAGGALVEPAPGSWLSRAAAQAQELVGRWRARCICVTLGADGALLTFGEGPPLVIPAPPARCVDPCGAGDRFSGVFTAMLAGKSLLSEAARAAVEAASEFVEHGSPPGDGVPQDGDVLGQIAGIRARGGMVVATGGCFDLLHAGHVATLRAARRLGDFLVVLLNSDASVRLLKGPGRPLVSAADRARVLEALECVDAVVVFDEDSPSAVLETLRPDIWAKGGDYGGCPLPEARILQSWGGQAVVLPYLDGRSTTALVAAAAQKSVTKSVSARGASR